MSTNITIFVAHKGNLFAAELRVKMNKLLKNTLNLIVPLTIGALTLYWVYKDFDFESISLVLSQGIEWKWMMLSLFFGVFSHIVRGWRWKLMLAPMGVTPRTSNCVNSIFVAYAANLLLPRVGEVSRCAVLNKYDKISFSKLLGSVVSERLVDVGSILFIAVLTFVLNAKTFSSFFGITGLNFPPLTSAVYLTLFIVLLLLLVFIFWRVLLQVKRFKLIVENLKTGIKSILQMKQKGWFLFYTLLMWLSYYLHFYLTFYCFNFTSSLGPIAGLVLFVLGTFAVIVPTPNGAGPWHFAIISMLTLYGVKEADGGTFALIVHGIQTFLVVLLCIYALIALPIINKKKYV